MVDDDAPFDHSGWTPTWREAVWAAIQRQAVKGCVTREDLIKYQLPQIVREVGSVGLTPHYTLSKELQALRDTGVLIFDGRGRYRVANGVAEKAVREAIATEVMRLQKARIGQGKFRDSLVKHWQGTCPMTGITEAPLLRASHIVPWNKCEEEKDRLDPENGLLLSVVWDAAFDRGIVTFNDDGTVLSDKGELSDATLEFMHRDIATTLSGLTERRRTRLQWHRRHWAEQGRAFAGST